MKQLVVRTSLFFRRVQLPHFFKLALAVLIAMAIVLLLHYPPVSAIMLIFYTLITVQTTIGGTLWFLRPMALWSIAGIIVGVVLALIFDPLTEINPLYTWIPVALVALYGALSIPITPFAQVTLFVALMIVTYKEQELTLLNATLSQLFFVVIALVISLLASLLFFPKRARRLLQESAAAILEKNKQLFQAALSDLLSPRGAASEEERQRRLKEALAEREEIGKLRLTIRQAAHEGYRIGPDQLQWLLTGLYRVSYYTVYFVQKVFRLGSNPLIEKTRGSLELCALEIQNLIERFAEMIRKGTERPDPESALAAKVQLSQAMEQAHDTIKQCTVDQLARYFSLYHSLEAFIDDLVEVLESFSGAKNG